MRKKCFFRLFSHLKRNENEIKQKQSEKTFISFRIEAKRKDWKRNEKIGSETKKLFKQNKAKIRSINFALVVSEKFEAKWSEKKRERKNRMRNGSRFASFRFEAKNFFFETGAP